jgi:hypothetical protein
MKVTCIALQSSVDDETFMDTMNVRSSFSQTHMDKEIAEEEEFNVDKKGKGLYGTCCGLNRASFLLFFCYSFLFA